MKEETMHYIALAALDVGLGVSSIHKYTTPEKDVTNAVVVPSLGELLAVVAHAAATLALAGLGLPVSYTPEAFREDCLLMQYEPCSSGFWIVY
jgi:hypothetical protein